MSAHVRGPLCIFDCPNGVGTGPERKCAADVLPQPGATWKAHGPDDSPTLDPSYHCTGGCGWHGFIVDGKAIDMPRVEGAIGCASTLHVCDDCKKPEIFVVAIIPQPDGKGLGIAVDSIDPRAKPASPIILLSE